MIQNFIWQVPQAIRRLTTSNSADEDKPVNCSTVNDNNCYRLNDN